MDNDFDKVSHNRLSAKLRSHGRLLSWIIDWLRDMKQRVLVRDTYSNWVSVLTPNQLDNYPIPGQKYSSWTFSHHHWWNSTPAMGIVDHVKLFILVKNTWRTMESWVTISTRTRHVQLSFNLLVFNFQVLQKLLHCFAGDRDNKLLCRFFPKTSSLTIAIFCLCYNQQYSNVLHASAESLNESKNETTYTALIDLELQAVGYT